MPSGGEDGVIIAIRDDDVRVEFRGSPYSKWNVNESSPMYQLHSSLRRIDISQLHNGEIEVVTPWHPEWKIVSELFDTALQIGNI